MHLKEDLVRLLNFPNPTLKQESCLKWSLTVLRVSSAIVKNSLLYLEMYKRKSGGPSLNGPDAAAKINNSVVIYNLQVPCVTFVSRGAAGSSARTSTDLVDTS